MHANALQSQQLLRPASFALLLLVLLLGLSKRYVDGRREFPNREVRLDRPPQEIEEDPVRGGPASAQVDPIYEVEAIIGVTGGCK